MTLNSQHCSTVRWLARHRAGNTLIEVAMATLVVGIVIVGSLQLVSSVIRTQTVTVDVMSGPHLADDLLNEIMALPYSDPDSPGGSIGTDSGEKDNKREEWDDVDDYDGWSRTPPRTKDFKVIKGYSGWTREVEVRWADRNSGNVWLLYDTGLKRITVTVTAPDGTTTVRRGYRSELGSMQAPPLESGSKVIQITGTLELGDSQTTSRSSTNLFNHVADPNEGNESDDDDDDD